MGKILSVCSGNGGVGKSTVALAVAVEAARQGVKTILLDASGIARACDLMLGLESVIVVDMMDVALQQSSVRAALYPVPGRSNLSFACASLYDETHIAELSGILLALRTMCDLLVIDLPSGMLPLELQILDEDDAVIMIVRPDDASIRSLQRLINTMPPCAAQRHLVINRINKAWVRKKIQYDTKTVEMILDMPVSCWIPEDESIPVSYRKGKTAGESSISIHTQIKTLLNVCL